MAFEKHISSYTHAFLFEKFNALRSLLQKCLVFQNFCFFQNFDRSRKLFDQSKLCLKCLNESQVGSINRKLFLINRKSYERFFKNLIFSWVKTLFQKKFLFSLSIRLGQWSIPIFCRFRSFLLQGFSLQGPVCLLYPFFFTYFQFFIH